MVMPGAAQRQVDEHRSGYRRAAGSSAPLRWLRRDVSAEFDLGLAPQASRAGRARFAAVLCRNDPQWTFRDAADRYYAIYPWVFEKRVQKEGTWVPFYAIQDIPNYQDFGVQFNESTQDFAWEAKRGLTPLSYIEPGCSHTDMYCTPQDDHHPQSAVKRVKDLLEGKRRLNAGWHPKDPWVYDAAAGILASYQTDPWDHPQILGNRRENALLAQLCSGPSTGGWSQGNSAEVESAMRGPRDERSWQRTP